LEQGKSTLKASTFDDLVAELDEIKTIAVAGKAAKDKKATKGA